MAKYREYKNGIYGHRYNGLYIIRGDKKGKFKVIDADRKEVFTDLYDFDECTWQIDKITASEDELLIARQLYEKEIFQLSSLYMELMTKKSRGELDEKSAMLFKWTEKVRNRKVEDRAY